VWRNNDVTSCCNATFYAVTYSPSLNLHHTWRRAVKGCNNMHIYCVLLETKTLVCRNYKICGRANTVRLCSIDFNTTRSKQTQHQQVLRRNGQNRQHSPTCARTTNRNVMGAICYRVGSALRLNWVLCAPTAVSADKSYRWQHALLLRRTKCQHVTAGQQHVSAVLLIFEQVQKQRYTPKAQPHVLKGAQSCTKHDKRCKLTTQFQYSAR